MNIELLADYSFNLCIRVWCLSTVLVRFAHIALNYQLLVGKYVRSNQVYVHLEKRYRQIKRTRDVNKIEKEKVKD